MPALSGTAASLLRKGSCLGASEQRGNRVLLPRIAHGHLCQLQVLHKRTPTYDC
jgi:hypothetical protein